MKNRLVVKREEMRSCFFLTLVVGFISLFLFSCQTSEVNEWTPPKFVKEWEIKEIGPGLKHEIISMTANKNGVYVLVKALEIKYSPPTITKSITEMTEKERKKLADQFVVGNIFSYSDFNAFTRERKEDVVDFTLKHLIPPKDLREMKDEEKEAVIDFLIKCKGSGEIEERLQREGRDEIINNILRHIRTAIQEEIEHYKVQEYDFEGNFVKEWPQVEMGFKKPIKILSDSSGNLYTADYAGNETVKFSAHGTFERRWKMLPSSQMGEGFLFKGFAMGQNDNLLVLGEGEGFLTPKLFQYDAKGQLIKAKELNSQIEIYFRLIKNYFFPGEKIERINDMAIDSRGEIFLLGYQDVVNKPELVKLTSTWKEKERVKVILREGFEIAKIEKVQKTLKGLADISKFDSTQMSWIENGPGFYFPSSVFIGGEYVYVTLLGSKPFGVIDAIIYDKRGKMVAYWKQGVRSHMDWYKSLDPNIEVVDENLAFAEIGSSMFVTRTMMVREGAFYMKNVIQRFDK